MNEVLRGMEKVPAGSAHQVTGWRLSAWGRAGAVLGVLLVLAAALALGARPAEAACGAPELRLSTDEVRVGHVVTVTGVGFGQCVDVIENGKREVPRPAEDIALSIQQGDFDFGIVEVDTQPEQPATFVQQIVIPHDFVPGEATITATMPSQDWSPASYEVSVPVTITTEQPTIRVAGRDRIETAVAVSRRAFPAVAATVYLARADMGVDAMVAGTLTDGPILLVPQCGDLPEVVAEELQRLAPGVIATLGGNDAVCDAMLQQSAALP